MRWQPEKPAADRAPTPSIHIVQMRVYMDDFAAQWAQLAAQMNEAFRHVGEQFSRMAPVIKELAEALDESKPATHGATSPRVPAYRDSRPRWQSPYGPQRAR